MIKWMGGYKYEKENSTDDGSCVFCDNSICRMWKMCIRDRLNSMIDLSDEEKKTAMESYQQEEEIAEQIFQT